MKNYSLIENEYLNIDRSFHKVYAHLVQSLYVIDGIWETDCEENTLRSILKDLNGEVLLVTQEFPDSVLVNCVSLTGRTKALEFLDYLFDSYGIIKGDASYARGKMSTVLLKVNMNGRGIKSVAEFFMERADSYYNDLDRVLSANFLIDNPTEKNEMKRYVKKNVPWAYVRTTDIAPAGTQILLKSLENDTGTRIRSGKNIIIMIGCLGEIYEITEEKFYNTYEVSSEVLNIFETYFDFIPAVELPESKEYITIDELAHLCYPKPGTGIWAKRLDKRTKVFRKGTMDYFVGQVGDYLAIRCDDETDIYIIQAEVFLRTYEETV